MPTEHDIAVVGAGILGLATARALAERLPGRSLVVLEKEERVAMHQSGRNSGVIHSGLYYEPGSLKARLCLTGAEAMVRFCEERGVPYSRNGKVVVATEESQLLALAELERRGTANGLEGLRRLDAGRLRAVEPHAAGIAALHVPSTGAVDFSAVARQLASGLHEAGVQVMTSFLLESVERDRDALVLGGPTGEIRARGMVNCGGLYADRIARLCGLVPEVQIVPFRGEYFGVGGASADLVRSSIYPVPDPDLPFLGVHLTRAVSGEVYAGPNAVLAGAREGYRRRTLRPAELWESVRFPGTWRLAGRHWRAATAELVRSGSRRRFAASVRKLVPGIDPVDLAPARTGVRAQAVTRRGTLAGDFLIQPGHRSVHVLNAPSPAATSSLVIGTHLATKAVEVLDLT